MVLPLLNGCTCHWHAHARKRCQILSTDMTQGAIRSTFTVSAYLNIHSCKYGAIYVLCTSAESGSGCNVLTHTDAPRTVPAAGMCKGHQAL